MLSATFKKLLTVVLSSTRLLVSVARLVETESTAAVAAEAAAEAAEAVDETESTALIRLLVSVARLVETLVERVEILVVLLSVIVDNAVLILVLSSSSIKFFNSINVSIVPVLSCTTP